MPFENWKKTSVWIQWITKWLSVKFFFSLFCFSVVLFCHSYCFATFLLSASGFVFRVRILKALNCTEFSLNCFFFLLLRLIHIFAQFFFHSIETNVSQKCFGSHAWFQIDKICYVPHQKFKVAWLYVCLSISVSKNEKENNTMGAYFFFLSIWREEFERLMKTIKFSQNEKKTNANTNNINNNSKEQK